MKRKFLNNHTKNELIYNIMLYTGKEKFNKTMQKIYRKNLIYNIINSLLVQGKENKEEKKYYKKLKKLSITQLKGIYEETTILFEKNLRCNKNEKKID